MKKIVIQIFTLVVLVALLFILKPSIKDYFSQKNVVSTSTVEALNVSQEKEATATTADNTWYQMFKKGEECVEGYSHSVIMMVSGEERHFCNLTSTIQEGPRLIGTGKEVYSLEGYYYEYGHEFYPFDYDPQRDKGYPKIFPCEAFMVTGGDQAFIDAYRKKIQSKFPTEDGRVVINLNYAIKDENGSNIEAPQQITSSTKDNPVTIQMMVHSFPERDSNPCDNYGLYIPMSYLSTILSEQDFVGHTLTGSDYRFRLEYPFGFKMDYANNHNSTDFELKIIDPKTGIQYFHILTYVGNISDDQDLVGPYPKVIPANTKNGEITVDQSTFNGIPAIHVTGIVDEGHDYADYFVFQRKRNVWMIDVSPEGENLSGFNKDVYMRIKESLTSIDNL